MGNTLTYEQYQKLSNMDKDLHDEKEMKKVRYKIEVLDSDSFDKLSYKKTKDSLGVALPDKGLAYIRKTGDKTEDIDTLLHELEELELPESWHEEIEDGERVRYKRKLGKIFGRPKRCGFENQPRPVARRHQRCQEEKRRKTHRVP